MDQLLAKRKARLLSQVTFGSVVLLMAGALATLLLQGTAWDPLMMFAPDQNEGRQGFDWDALARGLPPLDPTLVPPLFGTSESGEIEAMLPPATAVATSPGAPTPSAPAPPDPKLLAELKGYLEDGDRLLNARRFNDAEEVYNRAVKINPDLKPQVADKFFKAAQGYEKSRSYSRAQLLYKIALHFHYESARYHLALAMSYESLGDKAKGSEHRRLADKFSGS